MYITLYRKYRPKSFEEVCGESEIIRTIKNSLKENKMAHAYLFTGPRGVGKTTTARLIAKGLNCITNGITDDPCNECDNCKAVDAGNFFDLIEIDAASNRGIDEIRELKDKINYKPIKGRKKVYIIDEVHMLTKEAFNALLKTLEEPPEHALFILATTEPEKVLDTIISRCQRYDFASVSYEEMEKRLEFISKEENIIIDKKSLQMIYKKSGGSLRDAISTYEKVISYYSGESITSDMTEKALGVIPEKLFFDFYQIIAKKDVENGIAFLEKLWVDGVRIEEFFKNFAYYIKENMKSSEKGFSIEISIKIIEQIFDVLSKFRFEEDKRLLGYIILSKATSTNKEGTVVEKIIEKEVIRVVEKAETPKDVKKAEYKEEKEESTDLIGEYREVTFDEIKKKWSSIISAAKEEKISLIAFLNLATLLGIENNVLHIGFKFEHSFHKISMEKKENSKIVEDVLMNMFKTKIKVVFEIIGGKKKETPENELTKKVLEFFEDSEIIETR